VKGITDFFKSLKPFVGYIAFMIILVLLTAWFTGSSTAKSFEKVIDSRIDERIEIKLNEQVTPALTEINKSLQIINAKLDLSLDTQYKEQILQINVAVEAMKNDPGYVKQENIKAILERWVTLPDLYKTDDVKIRYEIIKRWYEIRVK